MTENITSSTLDVPMDRNLTLPSNVTIVMVRQGKDIFLLLAFLIAFYIFVTVSLWLAQIRFKVTSINKLRLGQECFLMAFVICELLIVISEYIEIPDNVYAIVSNLVLLCLVLLPIGSILNFLFSKNFKMSNWTRCFAANLIVYGLLIFIYYPAPLWDKQKWSKWRRFSIEFALSLAFMMIFCGLFLLLYSFEILLLNLMKCKRSTKQPVQATAFEKCLVEIKLSTSKSVIKSDRLFYIRKDENVQFSGFLNLKTKALSTNDVDSRFLTDKICRNSPCHKLSYELSLSPLGEIVYIWKIENFLNDGFKTENLYIDSEKFGNRLVNFFLRLYPKGNSNTQNTGENMSLHVHLEPTGPQANKVTIGLTCSILIDRGKNVNIKEKSLRLYKNQSDGNENGWNDFIERCTVICLSKNLPNGALTIYCRIWYDDDLLGWT